jgi:hypothetical protein
MEAVMHIDHDIFVQAIQNTRKIRLTFYDDKRKFNFTRLSVPIHYRSPRTKSDCSDCYYFWIPEADTNRHFLRLLPSQIVSMDLTEEAFDPERLTISERDLAKSQTKQQDPDSKGSAPAEPSSEEYDEIAKLAKDLAAKIKANGLSRKEKPVKEGK